MAQLAIEAHPIRTKKVIEIMEERKYSELRMPLDDDDKLATEMTIDGNKILPPNGYLIGKITQVDNGLLVEYVKKQPQYPKTYEECCELLFPNSIALGKVLTSGYNCELLKKFVELLICRDAYWKMSGNWSPDWQDSNFKYCIKSLGVDVVKGSEATICCILAFPTEEMRDAFYENFKELIELVKELL